MKTKAILLEIENGAIYQEFIWNYWLTFKLMDNSKIKVFDSDCLAKAMKLNNYYNITLSSNYIEEIENETEEHLTGIITKNFHTYVFKNDYIQIILSEYEGKEITSYTKFKFGRIDIKK